MRTNVFGTNFLNTQGSGTSRQNSWDIPDSTLRNSRKTNFEGGHELFGHHPFGWKTPTPPGGLRTQKVNLCALFSCLKIRGERTWAIAIRPFYANQSSELNFPIFLWGKRPEFRRKRDLYEPLLTAMAQVLPSLA